MLKQTNKQKTMLFMSYKRGVYQAHFISAITFLDYEKPKKQIKLLQINVNAQP